MINQFRYKQKQFWLEYALIAVQLLPYLFEAGTLEVSLCAFALALIKFRVEGLRINAALFVLTYLCYLLWGIGIVHLLLLLALLCFTLKLRVYNIPSTRQSIGYRRIRLDKAEIELFYPTNATEGRNDKRLFPEGVWNTMYDIVNKDTEHQSKLPWWVIYLTCHYYTRMLMPNTYPNVRPAAGCFPIMILSHQLGLNSLYSFAREFVDEGYFVISLIHRESIRNPFPGLEPNRLHRIEQLKERVQDVKRALDFAQDHKRFAKVMGEDLTLDFSRVNTYGHSFGASTCISAAMQDNRINGLVIAMDPCMYLFRDEDTIHPEKLNYNTKTLVILAEDYYETHYPSF
ncbi:MAG: hypothetical protein JST59_01485 [Actinobacteria bacterium]|nr:hypothetical protein [Actinomycetota bacterium]